MAGDDGFFRSSSGRGSPGLPGSVAVGGTLLDAPSVFDIAAVGTLAGSGRPGYRDGGLFECLLDGPRDVCALPDGSLLVADDRNNCLRRIHVNAFLDPTSPAQGVGTLTSSSFLRPRAPVVVDGGSGVIVADSGHHKIRLLQFTGSSSDLEVVDSIIAGSGRQGHVDGSATSAEFSVPSGVAVLEDGSVLVADSGNHCIRRIAPREGGRRGLHVSTIAGAVVDTALSEESAAKPSRGGSASPPRKKIPASVKRQRALEAAVGVLPRGGAHNDGPGEEARFHSPSSMVVDPSGLVFVSDTGNHCVRALHPPVEPGGVWYVTTVAGTPCQHGLADGAPLRARFNCPLGMTLMADGTLLVADAGNACVRCCLALPSHAAAHATSPFGEVINVAGTGERGFVDDVASRSMFRRPTSVCVVPGTGGCVAVCDESNSLVRLLLQRRTVVAPPPGLSSCLPARMRPHHSVQEPGDTVRQLGVAGRSPPRSQERRRGPPPKGVSVSFNTTSPRMGVPAHVDDGMAPRGSFSDRIDSKAGTRPHQRWTVEEQLAVAGDAAAAAMGSWREMQEMTDAGEPSSAVAGLASGSPGRAARLARLRQRAAEAVEHAGEEDLSARLHAVAQALREEEEGESVSGDPAFAELASGIWSDVYSKMAAQAALEAAGSPGASAALAKRNQRREAEQAIERRLHGELPYPVDEAPRGPSNVREVVSDAKARAAKQKQRRPVAAYMRHTAASVSRAAASGLRVPVSSTDTVWRFRHPKLMPYVVGSDGIVPDRRTPVQVRHGSGGDADRSPEASASAVVSAMHGLPIMPHTLGMTEAERKRAMVLENGQVVVARAVSHAPHMVPAAVAMKHVSKDVAQSHAIVQAFHPSFQASGGGLLKQQSLVTQVHAVRAYDIGARIPRVGGTRSPRHR
jgi:hypothetical protein